MNDVISRQAAIDEIEYELKMINTALDSTTLDFNARESLRQRRGEAKEILNSIQQLPPARQYIRCPEHINQFTFSQIQYENTFRGEDCEIAKAYGDCFHCFASSISKRDKEIEKSAQQSG